MAASLLVLLESIGDAIVFCTASRSPAPSGLWVLENDSLPVHRSNASASYSIGSVNRNRVIPEYSEP